MFIGATFFLIEVVDKNIISSSQTTFSPVFLRHNTSSSSQHTLLEH
jgi:hypothetical protein